MPNKHIVFVGATSDLRSGVEELSVHLGSQWKTSPVGSGAEALKLIEETSPDMVVVMMKLPDMSGADLLETVSKKFGSTVRFLASDQANKTSIVSSAKNVHQYIPLPIDWKALAHTIENSLALRKLLSNSDLCTRIAAVESLPSPPETYQQIVVELESEEPSIRRISDLIGHDINVTARLLQLVNSAYFGLNTRVESISHAVNLLGLRTVQTIVFSVGVFNQFADPHIPGFSINGIYDRSVAVGARARLIAHALGLSRRFVDDSLLSGMLHDVGKLLMLTSFQDELTQAVELSERESLQLHMAQLKLMGVTDALMGAHLLGLWGLPDAMVEAVAMHYRPSQLPSPQLNALTAVHIAFATEYDEKHHIHDMKLSALDLAYLTTLGISDQVQGLQQFCAGAMA